MTRFTPTTTRIPDIIRGEIESAGGIWLNLGQMSSLLPDKLIGTTEERNVGAPATSDHPATASNCLVPSVLCHRIASA